MNIRQLKGENDYQMLKSWMIGWNVPVIERENLIPTGFVAEENKVPIIAAHLILTDSPMTFIETVIANPKSTWQQRELGTIELFKYMSDLAFKLGYKKVLAMPDKLLLKNKIEKAGFETYSEKLFLCMKGI